MVHKVTARSTQAAGNYGIKAWDEKTWDGKVAREQPGAKLTHAKVTFTFTGDFEGEGQVQYLMAYSDDSFASFVGLQHMVGRLGDRSGGFVIQVNGVFEGGAAKSTWTIVPGSGTDDLKGVRGEGGTVAHHGDTQPFTLDYYFE